MDDGLRQILAYVVVFAGIPAVVAVILLVFVKKPFMRRMDRLLGGGPSWTVSRSVRISSGPDSGDSLRWSSDLTTPDPSGLGPEASSPAPMTPESDARYRDAWRRIEARFDDDPARAVRDAHALVLEVSGVRGGAGMLTTDAQLTAGSPAEAVEAFRSVFQQARSAREATQAAQRALSFGSADRAALRKALDQYARMLDGLLGANPLDDMPTTDRGL